MLKLLDLFSGIGGFSLGLERSGAFKTVAFCEIDPFCRRVLAKHWPEVPCYEDVTTLSGHALAADGITVDAICGGFPCQDISLAGKGAGIEGERSGLWREFARLIGDIRPAYAIIENVAALKKRGLDRVLRDLAALGYDAEWHCIPASAVGAPHQRDRIWIIAYPNSYSQRCERLNALLQSRGSQQNCIKASRVCENLANSARLFERRKEQWSERKRVGASSKSESYVAESSVSPLQTPKQETVFGTWWWEEGRAIAERRGWSPESDVGRVANGVPSRVDRLKGLGNSLVPQIPELIGLAIQQRMESIHA